MTDGKDQIVLHASIGFKDALGAYATTNKTSMADVIRKSVADVIGYDLSLDPARTRTPKYATPEEAKRVGLERATTLRWAKTTSSKLLVAGELEAAIVIARAIDAKDYDTLELLRMTSIEEATDKDGE